VTYSANIMASAVKRSGRYTYRVRELTDKVCRIEFSEGSDVFESVFTLEDAEQGGLTSGPNSGNWKKWPRNMLFARAMSNGCKWYCPDIFGGVTPYTPDELGAEVVVSDDGEMRPVVIDLQPPSAPRASTDARPVQKQPEPAADEMERARAMVDGDQAGPDRAELEAEYTRLAALAVERGHKDAAKIQAKTAAELSDSLLAGSIKALKSWEAKLAPIVTEDEPDEAF
jgi:hypothetical protein